VRVSTIRRNKKLIEPKQKETGRGRVDQAVTDY
jgi:hypothetical protein